MIEDINFYLDDLENYYEDVFTEPDKLNEDIEVLESLENIEEEDDINNDEEDYEIL